MPQFKVILKVVLREDDGKTECPGEDAEAPSEGIEVWKYYRRAGDLQVFQLETVNVVIHKVFAIFLVLFP